MVIIIFPGKGLLAVLDELQIASSLVRSAFDDGNDATITKDIDLTSIIEGKKNHLFSCLDYFYLKVQKRL